MSNNPLAKSSQPRTLAPSDEAERVRFWLDRGNRILWGHEPDSKGDYIIPGRTDLEWRHANGHYWIDDRQHG